VPCFKVQSDKLEEFKKLCGQFVEKTSAEPKCLYYGWSFDGNLAYCREGYEDAAALLAHLENVGSLLEEALKISEIDRLEIHGPAEDLAKLREPLADLGPRFLELEYGFRR
jgi:quinol monooxygenase YgiN